MSAALPTGTVTFVFTDVEGSTRLLEELGASRYGELLAGHHRACREAWAAHGGNEVSTAGDAFFVAFERAADALWAAAEAQDALAGLGMSVRMGVHTGEAFVNETGYLGMEVHRAARIAAAAHGGQVLVSAASAALVPAAAKSGGLVLRDLGEHRFKDLAAAERVFQLGTATFPPIRSLYRSNLPVPATVFLGRQRELGEVVASLSLDGVRLVTLTGPGGTGKTRLALQAAAEVSGAFPDGVWWLPLAPLRDSTLVGASLAHMLEMREEPGRDLVEMLAERLLGKRVLLVLDNAEHLLPGLAAELSRLRVAVPTLTLLVTSRERLQLAGEEVWRVPSLSQPEAVELFLTRAQAVGAPLVTANAAVIELCARLDNLPLALELAAARAVVFSPQQLLARLGQRLDLLKGGRDSDPRQLTLRATIDWSYELLAEGERRTLEALSVFAGGTTYEAAEQVAGADAETLQSLLDKSLLARRETDLGPRYSMLETIREYATERLSESRDESHVWDRFDDLMSASADALEEASCARPSHLWTTAYAEDAANFWLAIERARSSPQALARFVIALGEFWSERAEFATSREYVERALERLDELAPPLRAQLLVSAASVIHMAGDEPRAKALAQQAIPHLECTGDQLWLGRALFQVAIVEGNRVFPEPSERATRLTLRAIEASRSAGDDSYVAGQLLSLSELAQRNGEPQRALTFAAEADAIGQRLNSDLIRLWAREQEAQLARGRGDLNLCQQLVWEVLESPSLSGERPDPIEVASLVRELILVASERGDVATAARLAGASETLIHSTGVTGVRLEGIATRIARMREQGPQDLVEPALAEGRAMNTKELVEYARSHSPRGLNRDGGRRARMRA